MKRLLAVALALLMLLTFSSCFSRPKKQDTKYYVSHRMVSVEYKTRDGVWTHENVSNMIDNYHADKERSVDIVISYTFIADEPFHTATLTGRMGVGEVFNASTFEYQIYTSTISCTDIGEDILEAGEYTIIMYADDVCFYKVLSFVNPVDRDDVDIRLGLDVIRDESITE